jgi:hypothetical protein
MTIARVAYSEQRGYRASNASQNAVPVLHLDITHRRSSLANSRNWGGRRIWKGGRRLRKDGYLEVRLFPGDPFFSMVNHNQYVLEHRLVMAQHLGRPLRRSEIIHHINSVRGDNRIENLQIVGNYDHKQITVLEVRIRHLEVKLAALESENAILRAKLLPQVDGGKVHTIPDIKMRGFVM